MCVCVGGGGGGGAVGSVLGVTFGVYDFLILLFWGLGWGLEKVGIFVCVWGGGAGWGYSSFAGFFVVAGGGGDFQN